MAIDYNHNYVLDLLIIKSKMIKKIYLGDKIMNRWANIRDAFMRSLKTKSGQAAKNNYIYHEHLLFLLAWNEPSETESSLLLDFGDTAQGDSEIDEDGVTEKENIPSTSEASVSKPSSKKTRSQKDLNFLEKEIMLELKRQKLEECSFFKSFEPYITDMSENEKLQLHMDILKSISSIKSLRVQTVYLYNNNNQEEPFQYT